MPISKYNEDYIGSNSWLLKEVHGAKIFDGFILFSFRVIYLSVRILLRIILGKGRRDRLYKQKGINFKDFLYGSLKILGIDKSVLLKFDVPKYGYQVYCPINKEDLIVMSRHEDEIIDHFNTKQGDTVVDIGAHMGKYTLIASMCVGANGKVIAIEAHPGNYEMLNRNIKLNGLTNVTTLNFAVYSKEGKIKLYMPGEKSNRTIYNTLISTRATDEEKFVEVNADTLDDLLQNNEISCANVNWIKIDVEGAELEVLKGAHNIMSNSKNITLLIEVHDIENGKNVYKPIMDLMEKYNFEIEFEYTWANGEKHVILHKQVQVL